MFQGCVVLLAPFGTMTKTRRAIMAKNIQKHGGSVCDDVQGATHVIVSSPAVFNATCPLRVRIRQSMDKVVSEGWYDACMGSLSRADEGKFHISDIKASSTSRKKSPPSASSTAVPSTAGDAATASKATLSASADQRVDSAASSAPAKKGTKRSLSKIMSEEPQKVASQRVEKSMPASPAAPTQSTKRSISSSPNRGRSGSPKRPRVEGGRTVAPVHATLTPAQESLMRTVANAFACQRPVSPSKNHDATDNTALIALFAAMAENVGQSGTGKANTDQFRARAYRKTAAVLESLDFTVTLENAPSLKNKGIGAKSLLKIQEYLSTGAVKRAEILQTDPRRQALKELQKIWGVGASTADKWYARGITSLDELRKSVARSAVDLTPNQKIGLRFVEDFNCKIPRAEVTEIYETVKKIAENLPNFSKIECVGSYRRQQAECGDIDILICSTANSGKQENYDLLRELLSTLERKHLITHRLTNYTIQDMDSEHCSATFMGVFHLPGYPCHRRIDVKVWPQEQYAYALLHFTGNAYFNRSMRLYAKKLGYSLSDHGLCAVYRDGNQTTMAQAKSYIAKTEKDIFTALGLKYVAPEQRTIGVDFGTGTAQASTDGSAGDALSSVDE